MQSAVERGVREALKEAKLSTRDVSTVLRIHATAIYFKTQANMPNEDEGAGDKCHRPGGEATKVSVSIWRPPEDLLQELEEGGVYRVTGLVAKGKLGYATARREVFLSTSRNSKWERMTSAYLKNVMIDFSPRVSTPIADLKNIPYGRDFDTVAFVLHVGNAFSDGMRMKQWIFLADGTEDGRAGADPGDPEAMALLAILFSSVPESFVPIESSLFNSLVGWCNLIRKERDTNNSMFVAQASEVSICSTSLLMGGGGRGTAHLRESANAVAGWASKNSEMLQMLQRRVQYIIEKSMRRGSFGAEGYQASTALPTLPPVWAPQPGPGQQKCKAPFVSPAQKSGIRVHSVCQPSSAERRRAVTPQQQPHIGQAVYEKRASPTPAQFLAPATSSAVPECFLASSKGGNAPARRESALTPPHLSATPMQSPGLPAGISASNRISTPCNAGGTPVNNLRAITVQQQSQPRQGSQERHETVAQRQRPVLDSGDSVSMQFPALGNTVGVRDQPGQMKDRDNASDQRRTMTPFPSKERSCEERLFPPQEGLPVAIDYQQSPAAPTVQSSVPWQRSLVHVPSPNASKPIGIMQEPRGDSKDSRRLAIAVQQAPPLQAREYSQEGDEIKICRAPKCGPSTDGLSKGPVPRRTAAYAEGGACVQVPQVVSSSQKQLLASDGDGSVPRSGTSSGLSAQREPHSGQSSLQMENSSLSEFPRRRHRMRPPMSIISQSHDSRHPPASGAAAGCLDRDRPANSSVAVLAPRASLVLPANTVREPVAVSSDLRSNTGRSSESRSDSDPSSSVSSHSGGAPRRRSSSQLHSVMRPRPSQ
ncbi:hypothetical protein CBR_g19769 [Chara braunii]|uniref:Uncharacterized protein n=1 Tax=Chara braunii TaxID=69332 RepID=A0A388JTZ3_CHABU|nr:hypothetical protein CBR_g19769 [Chara braunii]|eukprot:GBG61237.1 hypothetical protein CBR_g19769 [Chara braunii]